MAINSSGYAVTDLPQAPVVPDNIGKLDVAAIYNAVKAGQQAGNNFDLGPQVQALAQQTLKTGTQQQQATQAKIPSATAADIGTNTSIAARAPLATARDAAVTGGIVAEQPSATGSAIAMNTATAATAPSTAASTIAQNTAAAQDAQNKAEAARQDYLNETDPTAKAIKRSVYVSQLQLARDTTLLTKTAYDQELRGQGINPDAQAQPTAGGGQPTVLPPVVGTGSTPLATTPSTSVPVQAPVSDAQISAPSGIPQAAGAPSAPLAAPAPAPTASTPPLAAPVTAPLATPSSAGQGNAPLSLSTSNVDPTTGVVTNRVLSPEGPKFTFAQISPGAEKQQADARDSLLAAGLDPKQFQNSSGLISDPGTAIEKAMAITSAPTIPGKALPIQYPNPGAGLPPVDAAKARNAEQQKSANVINQEVSPVQESVDNVEAALRQFKQLNSQTGTGVAQGNKYVKLAKQLWSEGAAKLNLEDPATLAKVGLTPQDASDPNTATAIQLMTNIHDSLIPQLIRTLNPAISTGASGGGTSGGPSGLGRIMQTEVPWLAALSPSLNNEKDVNDIIADRAISESEGLKEHVNFLSQYQKDGGTLDGAGNIWNGYREANPKFDQTGNPAQPLETWQQYLARVGADPSQAGKAPPKSAAAAPAAASTPTKYTQGQVIQANTGNHQVGDRIPLNGQILIVKAPGQLTVE